MPGSKKTKNAKLKNPKPEPAIEVKNVSKAFKLPHESKSSLKQHFVGLFSKKPGYERFEALKDINFTVNKGDFFGIVGRNGSGKSTLLKIISGIYQPTSGAVKLNGTLTPFIELGIGFNTELTGRENVYLNGSILGLTKKQIDDLYDEIVDFAELHKFMDQKLKNYSSGMSVRLAFSIAIRAQNDLLLLDEVLAVGDINFQKKCFDYFQKLKSEKKTVVFVTHDMGAVKEYCNKAVLINDSKIVLTEDVNDVLEKYMEIMNPTAATKSDITKKIGEKDNHKTSIRKNNSYIAQPVLSISDDTVSTSVKLVGTNNMRVNEFYMSVGIFDNLGLRLFGYNTLIAGGDPLKKSSSDINLKLEFKNILSDGKYYINFAIVDRDNNIIELVERAKKFIIRNNITNSTPVNALNKISINYGEEK